MMEPNAYNATTLDGQGRERPVTISEMAAVSQAVSLKRIADVLDGTAVGLNVAQTVFGAGWRE